MRTCPTCGRENADRSDFCRCGEYLRWEATEYVWAVASIAPVTQPRADHSMIVAPAVKHAKTATLVLTQPGEEGAAGGAPTARVKAGEQTKLLATVRNESSVIDNYDLAVRGLPHGWWTISPATVYLVPYGNEEAYEQQVEVHLHPPRTDEAHAREWPIEVVAVSRALSRDAASARAMVRIDPYQDVATKIAPDRASGRLKARFVVTMRNRSNDTADLRLEARDGDGECRFRFASPAVTLEAGKGVEAPVTVFPQKQIWLGRPKDRAVTVTATRTRDQAPQVLVATFRQRPWLPWWLSLAAPLAAALAAVFVLFLPKQVVVPSFKRAGSVFAAEKLAIKAGLKLSPQVSQVQSSTAKPGAIVDQAPAAGTKVKRGTIVQLAVAVSSDTTKVPQVIDSTPLVADATLRADHLQLGTVSPQPSDPNGSIASQIPAVGAEVRKGTAVAVFLKPTQSKHAGAAIKSHHPIVLPAVAGTVAAAAQQLSRLGFEPTTVPLLSSRPAGQLVRTDPASGSSLKPGATVQLVVSAGYPKIAYDDGSKVHVVDGAIGTPAGSTPPGRHSEEATWTPDGKRIAYVQGASPSAGQLMLFAPGSPGATPVALTAPGSNVRDPAFAPGGHILAFIDRSQGSGRLCFATLSTSTSISTSNCTTHAGYDLGGQISWSPDGKAILVFGANRTDTAQHGLLEFRTATAFSPNASAWDQGSPATQPNQDVIAGAFSSDGRHVASYPTSTSRPSTCSLRRPACST